MQHVPSHVAFTHHGLELTGAVGPVLPGQTTILVVDQLQVGQSLVNLPLETLKTKDKAVRHFSAVFIG